VKATSLLMVFVVAKLLVLVCHGVALSPWAPGAYFWQDVLAALLFAAFDWCIRRAQWLGWGVYALLTVYVAVNVPIACTLATPLTWPLLRATRGTLADSIGHHVTLINLARMAVVLIVAAAAPFVVKRICSVLSLRLRAALVAAAAVSLPLGPLAAARLNHRARFSGASVRGSLGTAEEPRACWQRRLR
jgi:hypothetical protein